MKTTSKLALSSLKKTKSKSILVIITIMLSTILLTSVGITCANWFEMNKLRTVEDYGSNHSTYKSITEEQVEVLENHISIEKFGVQRTVANSEYGESTLSLVYLNENTKEMRNVRFIEGNLPAKENEIAIQDGFVNLLGGNATIGEKINIQYETRDKEKHSKEFIITGLLETSEFNRGKGRYSAVVSEEFLKNNDDMEKVTFNGYIRLKDEDKLSRESLEFVVKDIAKNAGISEYDVRINDSYLNVMKPELGMIVGVATISLIIMLSSILVIYSVFYVSIIVKVQEYGKIRAMGATKKQIKNIIFKEGLLLSAIAIPMGLIIGWFIGDVIMRKLLLMDEYNVGSYTLAIIIIAAIVSLITVYLSLLKPMKIASKVSPIEAIRFNGEDNVKGDNRKGYKSLDIKKLTYANIARNKKKGIITLLSLSLSGILFITVSSVLSSMKAENMVKGMSDFVILLDNYTFGSEETPESEINVIQVNSPIGEDFRNSIKTIEGVESIEVGRSTKGELITNKSEKIYTQLSVGTKKDIEELKEKYIDGKVDYEALNNEKGIILNYPKLGEECGIKVGDTIKVKIYDGKEEKLIDFKVLGITQGHLGEFVITDKLADELFQTDIADAINITVNKKNIQELTTVFKEITSSNPFMSLSTREEEVKNLEGALKLNGIMGYSLVVILGIIGFINLVNTMITSIITRKKELGMLQAIGLTNRQLVKMLQLEGLFYIGGALAITLTIGNLIGYIATIIMKNTGADYIVYNYPIIQTIIMVTVVVVGQFILTRMISKNFNKESLIDRVRYSE